MQQGTIITLARSKKIKPHPQCWSPLLMLLPLLHHHLIILHPQSHPTRATARPRPNPTARAAFSTWLISGQWEMETPTTLLPSGLPGKLHAKLRTPSFWSLRILSSRSLLLFSPGPASLDSFSRYDLLQVFLDSSQSLLLVKKLY